MGRPIRFAMLTAAAINAAPADRLPKALTALGSLVKTIHILRYIHNVALRQAIQLQLNCGEFRHIVAKQPTLERQVRCLAMTSSPARHSPRFSRH